MESKESLLDKINNMIPDSIKQLLGVGGDIATILIPLGSLVGLIFSWFIDNNKPEDYWKNHAIIILSIITGVLFYRLMRQKKTNGKIIHKMQSEHENKLKEMQCIHLRERSIFSQKYYQLLHDYRNVINDMEYSYKKNKLTETELTVLVTHFLENALDYLVDTLKEMTGHEISGCVKAIIGGNCNRISYEDAKVNTFVRSHNTNPARKSLDQQDEEGVLVRENTDFLEIVAEDRSKNDSVFYQPNLKEYAEQLKSIGKVYKNSTPCWDKYYIGTIVAPIRIASKRLFYLNNNQKNVRRRKNKNNNSVYYILGFLCVDSLSEEAFTLEQKDNYTFIVKSYAAEMFNILSKNQFYLKRLHENGQNMDKKPGANNINSLTKTNRNSTAVDVKEHTMK